MTRMPGVVLIAAILLLGAPCASMAQNNNGAPPPGTNSAGTAQSSGPASNRAHGVTTGAASPGSGNAAPPATPNTDAAIKAENNILDRKLKSICRGC